MQPIASPGGAVGVMIHGRLSCVPVLLLKRGKERLMGWI